VREDGLALKHIKEQTPAICKEAVKQTGYALQYVNWDILSKEQIYNLCIESVKRDGYILGYVKEQTPEICLEAVKQNGYALRYV
ncbi:DUF4116 domain-containing protein, partial [Clostridioides difficile]